MQQLGELYVRAHGVFTSLIADIPVDPFGLRDFESLHHDVCERIEQARSLVICSAYEHDLLNFAPPASPAPVTLPTEGEASPVRLSGV